MVLVTGGAGFLGRALVAELLKGGSGLDPSEIRVYDLRRPEIEDGRVVPIVGDVRSYGDLLAAVAGVDLVFHAAALVDWGQHPVEEVESVNVAGTENVIRACREAGVRSLVFTSTLDVVFTGRPVVGGDESLPYPERHADAYCRTKAEAEQAVVRANGTQGLSTVVLRPLSIFGEGDEFHVGSLVRMARWGRVFRVGSGRAVTQFVYVGNVAHAHVLAGRSLLAGESVAAGRIYFITDFAPRNFFDFLEPILAGAGVRVLPWALGVPRPVAYGAAVAAEAAARLFGIAPTVTRFAVDFVCLDFTFDGSAARRDLGYSPVYSEAEAITRTIEHLRAQSHMPRSASKQGGDGSVALHDPP